MTRVQRMKVCAVSGCPDLVPEGTTYCPAHDRARNRAGWRGDRGDAPVRSARWVYRDKRWQGTRRAVLRRDPVCVDCRRAVSTQADHRPPVRDVLAAGGDPFDPAGAVGVCADCHRKATTREIQERRR